MVFLKAKDALLRSTMLIYLFKEMLQTMDTMIEKAFNAQDQLEQKYK